MSESLKSGFIEKIKSKILSGELKPGDRLPSERELASLMGLSRGSVNQGILDLERMGFLKIVPRKGTFVSEYGENATPETLAAIMSYDSAAFDPDIFKDFMELRIIIERDSVRLICLDHDTEKLKLLEKAEEEVYSSDEGNKAEAVYQYHKCLADISGNRAYTLVFQSFSKMIRNLIAEHYKDKKEAEESQSKIEKLTKFILLGDAAEADSVLCDILNSASDYLGEHLKKQDDSLHQPT